ncbi:lipoate--protein ligase family protein [Thermoleophilia bacterium SCSIO 60948]|nr:lipoate--protein ligase family protein [Thermoleophilia bacterium SCSIO 60948]
MNEATAETRPADPARPREIALVRHPTPEDPALGTAITRVVLEHAASGELGATARLQRTGPVVTFGRQDSTSPGFADAVAAAREQGFRCTLRLAGGRAAVFHEGTVAFSIALPDPTPRRGTQARFLLWSEFVTAALRRVGVDARVGEVEGEYCPGSYSVNARGRVKLAGVGQRLIDGAAHVGGVIVAGDSARLRDVLIPVYEALGLDWRPETAGAAEDEVPGADLDAVESALLNELDERFDVSELELGEGLLEEAVATADRHEAELLTGRDGGPVTNNPKEPR